MSKPLPRIYWDANAWIAYIKREMPALDNKITDPRHTMCKAVLSQAEAGEVEIVTSAFTMAEVCKRRDDPVGPEINLPAFFDQPYILIVPVDKRIGQKAQHLQLSGVGKVKPADATHLASAMVSNVPIFHTFDGGLLDLNKVLTLNDGRQLQIVKPTQEIPLPGLLAGMQANDEEGGAGNV